MEYLKYLEKGKSLILLNPNSKTPCNAGWTTHDYDKTDIESHNGNLGWRLGSNDIVLDIDPRNGGQESFFRLCSDLKLSLQGTVTTAGGGFHVYFKLPSSMVGWKFKKELPEYKGIDFLTKGRYVVIAGSVVDDKFYRFALPQGFYQAELPDTLGAIYRKVIAGKPTISDDESFMELVGSNANWSDDKVKSVLDKIDPDVGHDEWVNVGMALHHWHPVEGKELWNEWSKGSDKYDLRVLESKWRSFSNDGGVTMGTLVHMAREVDFNNKRKELDDLIAKVSRASDMQLEVVLPKQINKMTLNTLESETIVQAYKERFAALGFKVTLPIVRQMLFNKAERVEADKPEWCDTIVFNNTSKEYIEMDTMRSLSTEAFNLVYGKYVPLNSQGSKQSASKYVADNGYIRVIDNTMYLPHFQSDDKLIQVDGKTVLNTYDITTVPVGADELDEDGVRIQGIIWRHLMLLCNQDEQNAKVLLYWLAHQVQNVGVKLTWSPVIQSIQGIGKSFIGNVLRAVMGMGNVGVVSSMQVCSNFNSWAEGVCVNVLEELRVQGHNRHEIVNNLKPLITDTSIQINRKGVSQYSTVNVTNYICFTNFKDALPLTEDNRRWWVIFNEVTSLDEISDICGMSKEDYYKELHSVFSNVAQLRAVFEKVTIEKWFEDLKTAPITKYSQMMINDELTNMTGYFDVVECIGNVDYVGDRIISSAHIYEHLAMEDSEFCTVPDRSKGLIFRKLGYIRSTKRKVIGGKRTYYWYKSGVTERELFEFSK